jgi:hypothetical protein
MRSLKNTITRKKKKKRKKKKADGVAQGVGPEFKPQYCKKKKKRTSMYFLENYLLEDIAG